VQVRIEDPPGMNVLGLFLAAALRRSAHPCALAGILEVGAGRMRAQVRFASGEAVVTRAAGPAKATVTGSLPALVEAIVRPRLRALLRLSVRGSRLFAWRTLQVLRP